MSFPSLNDRDALLESAVARLTNTGAYKVVITPSAENFSVNAAGTPAVAILDLTATFIGLSGPVTWSAQNGTISNITGANNANAQLAFASVTGSFVKVTASVTYAGRTYSTERIIGITKDGAGSYTWTKYSNSSNGAAMQDSPTGMSYIGQAFNKPTATPSTTAADYVWTLFKGADGTTPNKNHTAFLYQWSTAVPAKPNGASTFTWASGVNTAYAGTDNWKVAPDANPGTPGMQLFVIGFPVTAANSATTTTVSVANYATAAVVAWSQNGNNGTNGTTGVQSGEAVVYRWDTSLPTGPVGSPTFTWASQSFGAAPTNWTLTPGSAPSPGMTLWKTRVLIVDSAAAVTTGFNWVGANTSITAVGYAGTNGNNGTAVWVEISNGGAGQVYSRADSNGTFAPASITLTATQYGPGTATYLWQYWDGSAWVNAGSTAATLAVGSATAFTASRTYRVQMTVGGTNYYDEMTLVKVTGGKDGVNGTSAIVGFLTNESAAVPASNSGTVSAGDLSAITGTFKVFEGVVDKTGNGVAYSVSSETGVDVSINPTTGAYSVVSFGSDQGAAVLQAVYGGVTIQKVFSLAKAKAGTSVTGAEGVSYVTAYCASSTSSTTTAPANTVGRNSVPVLNGGGITGTWSKTVPTLADGQFMYQVDGLYNPATDTVVWSIPYWSSLKVGTLSAIVANLGAITGGSIDIGTGATSWHVDSNGNTWAGAATFAAAPYRVSNAGAVTMTSVTISGGKVDIGSGNTSFHVDNLGNMWMGNTSYALAPFRVDNTGTVRMSKVDIINSSGQTVLSSGLPLSQQVGGAPNLAPRLSAWAGWPNGSMSWIYADPLGRTSNGEMAIFEQGDPNLYIGRDSPNLNLRGSDWVTVSFMIVSNADGSLFNCDIYGDNGAGGYVDTAGKTGFAVPNGVPMRVVFTEQLPAQVGAVRLRLWKANYTGQIGVWDVKVARGKVDTPYSEDIITPGNIASMMLPGSVGNTQFGGNLFSSNWNGWGGTSGWLLDRAGNMYMNNAYVRGTVSSSLIETSAFRLNAARLLSKYDRLCPFSMFDANTQMWSSGSGYCEIQLTGFTGPASGAAWSYNAKRFSEEIKDVFLKATVGGNQYVQIVIGVMYNNDGNWNWIVSPGMDLSGGTSRTISIRYTTTDWTWTDMKFACWTQAGAAVSLAFEMSMSNQNSSQFGAHTNSGIATSTPPPPPPPPPYEEDPYCVDFETARFPDGSYVRDVLVDDMVEVWNEDPILPGTEYVAALEVTFGYEESYRILTAGGAELLQSKSTPMTLRDGSYVQTPALLGEDVLVKRGSAMEWERVVSLENIGVRKVVKLCLGDRTFFAGSSSDATIATHNIQQLKR